MLKPIEKILKEHEQIERELIELETIMDEETINYPNLIHTLRRLTDLWEKHEKKEDIIFPFIERKNSLKIPVEKALSEHEDFRVHRKAILEAMEKGEYETKKKLEKEGRELISNLREHMNMEDEMLYTLSKYQSLEGEEVKHITEKIKSI